MTWYAVYGAGQRVPDMWGPTSVDGQGGRHIHGAGTMGREVNLQNFGVRMNDSEIDSQISVDAGRKA